MIPLTMLTAWRDAVVPVDEKVPAAGGGGELWLRGPQSEQSVPYWQPVYAAPGPPSSQKPSEPQMGVPMHSLVHCPTVPLS